MSYALIRKPSNGYLLDLQNNFIEAEYIKLPLGSQGLKLFDNKYKIIWSYMNYSKFFYSNKKIMIDYNLILISTNDFEESLFLLSVLNSKINNKIIDFFFRIPNEQAILLGLTPIKQFIRIPKITNTNKHIKKEIIKLTQKILDLENKKLSDYIDFSKIRMQQFDKIYLDDSHLILIKNNEKYKLKITNTQKFSVIKRMFEENKFKTENISLPELKSMTILDKEEQNRIKNYIDDLVFALYFNVSLSDLNYKKATEIKKHCMKNEYYGIINQIIQ